MFFLKAECTINPDCPSHLACIDASCSDPCQRKRCGDRAICEVNDHIAKCFCPPGLQGNPLVNCIDIGCQSDDSCRDNESCNLNTETCEPLCQASHCAVGAICEAKRHEEKCTCKLPLRGDGYAYCDYGKFIFMGRY